MKAIEVEAYGDSDELSVVDAPTTEPDAGEVRIAIEAAGINFADIMQRRGHYPGGPDAPYVPGMEAAGTVDAVGDGVEDLSEGDRVVGMLDTGGYAEYVTAAADALFPIPDAMSAEEAAGFPVQFLTAHACLFEWGGLEADESVLIQAAAGGSAPQLSS